MTMVKVWLMFTKQQLKHMGLSVTTVTAHEDGKADYTSEASDPCISWWGCM